MNHYVYEITNKLNGRKYIGKRSCKCNIEDDKYMGSGYALRKAINKYGLDNFKKTIIYICNTETEAYNKERDLIKKNHANTSNKYYNISEGGNGFTTYDAKKFYEENKDSRLKTIRSIQNKKIVLLNNNKVFNSLVEARDFVGLKSSSSITMCCKGQRESAGKFKNAPAVWIYYDEYIKSSKDEIDKKIGNAIQGKNKKVVLLNTGEIFDSAEEAKIKVGMKSKSSIQECCNGKWSCAGTINNEPAIWMYYDKYKQLSKIEIDSICNDLKNKARKKGELKESTKLKLSENIKSKWKDEVYLNKQSKNFRSVICLNNKKVFKTLKSAYEFANIKSGIDKCCKCKRSYAGIVNGEKLKWMYYDEYLKNME